ncbi:hypothetical protein Dimus_028484 [Dionaea muscipula]
MASGGAMTTSVLAGSTLISKHNNKHGRAAAFDGHLHVRGDEQRHRGQPVTIAGGALVVDGWQRGGGRGLTWADLNTRASIVGSADARSEKILPEGEVHDSSDIRAEVQSTPEDVGIVWADEEDERIENEIAVNLVRGAPYRNAVQFGLEEKGANPELESNSMAGNRDVSKG